MIRSIPLIAISEVEEEVAEMYASVLRSEGYEILTFEDKCTLFNLLRSLKPDLIITSVRSTSIDGLEFLKSVRTSYGLREIPVIVATAHSELREQAFRLGATDFLAKPFVPEELKDAVRSALASLPSMESETQSQQIDRPA